MCEASNFPWTAHTLTRLIRCEPIGVNGVDVSAGEARSFEVSRLREIQLVLPVPADLDFDEMDDVALDGHQHPIAEVWAG